MKRLFFSILVIMVAVIPAGAQSKKAVKLAKADAKYELKHLKDEGYKPIDDVKLDDAVRNYLATLYDNRNCVEVVGRVKDSKDINEAKSLARREAIGAFPENDVENVLFLYKKKGKKYDVLCHALVNGASAASAMVASGHSAMKGLTMASSIANEKANEAKLQAKKEADKEKAKAKKEVKKAKAKAKAQAKKEADKVQAKAKKEADGIRSQANKEAKRIQSEAKKAVNN